MRHSNDVKRPRKLNPSCTKAYTVAGDVIPLASEMVVLRKSIRPYDGFGNHLDGLATIIRNK